MRDYGKVHTSFWSSATIRSMSEDGRALAIYLLTSPHGTIAGVMRLPDGYVCEDLQWGTERVAQGFAELFTKGFANRCETTKWVWICKHLEWNAPENPNQRKSARKVALSVPDECAWKPEFLRVSGASLEVSPPNPSETVSQPLPNQKQEQEQEQEQEKDIRTKPAAGRISYPAAFEDVWKAYPTDKLMSKKDGFAAWKKLPADDKALLVESLPAFRAHCAADPTYRPVHFVRYVTQRRFDGMADKNAPPPVVSQGRTTDPDDEIYRGVEF